MFKSGFPSARYCILNTLATPTQILERFVKECPICTGELTDAVITPCKHFYCRECFLKWFNGRTKNTCPIGRTTLFRYTEADRGPVGDDRIWLVTQAFEHSGLVAANRFDFYNEQLAVTIVDVQRAAAEAFDYLVAESRAYLPGSLIVDTRGLRPHITAMSNMLRGYAAASVRPYTAHQNERWKLINRALIDTLLPNHGQIQADPRVTDMAAACRRTIRQKLAHSLIDIHEGLFFDNFAEMDSPSGDLDVLLAYVVFQCGKTFERRQDLIEDQKEALRGETTAVGYSLRRLGQILFGGV